MPVSTFTPPSSFLASSLSPLLQYLLTHHFPASTCPKCPALTRALNNLATSDMTNRKKIQALRRFNRRLDAKLEAAMRAVENANAVIGELGAEVVCFSFLLFYFFRFSWGFGFTWFGG